MVPRRSISFMDILMSSRSRLRAAAFISDEEEDDDEEDDDAWVVDKDEDEVM